MKTMRDIIADAGFKLLRFSNRFNRGPAYSKDGDTTFVCGATQAKDVLADHRERVVRLYEWEPYIPEFHYEKTMQLAREAGVPIVHTADPVPSGQNSKRRFSVALEIEKWKEEILPGTHIVLVEPTMIINIGTVIRCALAFGVHDVAIISEKEFDSFDPGVIRSSMGTRLAVRIESFSSAQDYLARFPDNQRYAFMLDETAQRLGDVRPQEPYSLFFGNETRGLPEEYKEFCQPVFIEQSDELNSLNLSVAAGVALYTLSGRSG